MIEEPIEIIRNGYYNLQERNGRISSSDIEAEVINQACFLILRKYRRQIKMVADVNQINTVMKHNMAYLEIAMQFTQSASILFPEQYTEEMKSIANLQICSNISWSAMWDFLRDYFHEKHQLSIDDKEIESQKFRSKIHHRYEFGVLTAKSPVERHIKVTLLNDELEILVAIEPTLSSKKAKLRSRNERSFHYQGEDPDFEFIILYNRHKQIVKLEMVRTDRHLSLVYM